MSKRILSTTKIFCSDLDFSNISLRNHQYRLTLMTKTGGKMQHPFPCCSESRIVPKTFFPGNFRFNIFSVFFNLFICYSSLFIFVNYFYLILACFLPMIVPESPYCPSISISMICSIFVPLNKGVAYKSDWQICNFTRECNLTLLFWQNSKSIK